MVLVSIVGTQITDALTDGLEISLYTSTAAFAAVLAAIFALWYASERTLSIHTIVTSRRETFYWAAILFTFALGTAAGDLATEALGLGFRLGVLIGPVALAHRFGLGAITSFWMAYILTRPLGASLGDLLSQSRPNGGLGTSTTNLVFLTVIVVIVGVESVKRSGLRPRSALGGRPAATFVSSQPPERKPPCNQPSATADWSSSLPCRSL